MKKIIFLLIYFASMVSIYANKTLNFIAPIIDETLNSENSIVSIELDNDGKILNIKNQSTSIIITVDYEKNGLVKCINQNFNKELSSYKLSDYTITKTSSGFSITGNKDNNIVFQNGGLYFIYTKSKKIYTYYAYRKNKSNFNINHNFGYFYHDLQTQCKPSDIAKIVNKNQQINENNAKILANSNCCFLIPFLLCEVEGKELKAISYNASSQLKEGSTSYNAENLRVVEGLPWASANGYGIDDEIVIEVPSVPNLKLKFYNGFQSSKNPNLYKANSRAKIIEISNPSIGYYLYYKLRDTPEEQILPLKLLNIRTGETTKIKIKVIEVYPGEKYNDLCIQAIIPEFY